MTSHTKRARARQESVTGRDGYIVCGALAYAIVAIEMLPDKFQEWSNKEDMKLLLQSYARSQQHFFIDQAKAHLTGGHSALSGNDTIELEGFFG